MAHISGAVVAVDVAVGDTVEKGQRALVLEAMKIESPVCCELRGTVTEVRVAAGARVERGAILIVVEPDC